MSNSSLFTERRNNSLADLHSQGSSQSHSSSKLPAKSLPIMVKKLSMKLSPLIKAHYEIKLTQPNNPNDRKQQHLVELLQNFDGYIQFPNDGNSLYRILAIHHMKYISENGSERDLFVSALERQQFDLSLLGNIPKQRVIITKKSKLISTYLQFYSILSKTLSSLNFYKSIAEILDKFPIYDFALVCLYRIYAYSLGYKRIIGTSLENFMQGDEKLLLTTYGSEVSTIIIKILAETFNAKIHVYSVSEYQIQYNTFVNEINQPSKFQFTILIADNRYAIVIDRKHQKSIIKPLKIDFQKSHTQKSTHQTSHKQESVISEQLCRTSNILMRRPGTISHQVVNQKQLRTFISLKLQQRKYQEHLSHNSLFD